MPHRRPLTAALLLALAPLACSTASTAPEARAQLEEGGGPVALTRLRPGSAPLTHSSGVREPARLVVRDAALWEATWTAIWSNHRPEPDRPAIDFAREMVVVAAAGERNSGGHAIFVDSAAVEGSTLVVHVRTVTPGPRCYVTAALTQPVDAARLPRHDGPVQFRDHAEVFHCD